MSPEQALGDPVDARTDVYAWGVVAYEVLNGGHPFPGRTTAQALIAAHVHEPPGAWVTNAAVPAPLHSLVMRCLAKDASERPASGGELLEALEAAASGEVAPGRTPARDRRRWWALGVSVKREDSSRN